MDINFGKKRTLKKEMNDLLDEIELARINQDWERYNSLTEVYGKLSSCSTRGKLDPNTIFSGVVSFGSIATILGWERIHVIATKALTFVPKLTRFL